MTIDPSVKNRFPRKYSSIIGHAKYDGLKGPCQKICCSKTVKIKKAFGIFFNKKLQRIRGLKGMCRNKMKRYFTHDFSSFYSDTFPLILVFYAAFFEEYNCFLHFKSFSATDLLILSLFIVVTFGWALSAMDQYRYYRSCWLPIVSIHR
jgi:hypothetical protein